MPEVMKIDLPECLTGELLTGLDELDAQHEYRPELNES